MYIVSVIPLKRGLQKEELTYFTAQEISLFSVVNIPMRKTKILGLVTSIEDVSKSKSNIKEMNFNLKKITEIKGHSIFKKELIESIFLISKYFVSKNNISINSIIPSIFREEYDKISNSFLKQNTEKTTTPELKKIKPEKLLFQNITEDRISYYKTLIRESFAKKKSVFLVLPTERDISIFYELLSKGVENFCIPIHGGLSAKKQLEKIDTIISNSHSVLVLGTAPFLAIPRNDFETIILEHESSNAYKMIAKPYFDLRIYVEIFASKINAKLIIADSLLSHETIARKELDNLGEVHPLSFKINFKGQIEIPEKEEKFKVLRDDSIKEIQNSINKNENVFIFSLRKGLASITICRDCNQEILCKDCLAPLVLYLSRDGKKRIFSCNRCKKEINTEMSCENCGSWNLMPLGIGTDTVFEEVKKQFNKVKIFKLDKENIKTNKEAEKLIHEFYDSPGSILIGTEMALFYLKEKLPLSIIASLDSLYSIPNYKINEKVIQIITSIIRNTARKLIIQTKNERDPAIIAIINENLLSFVREEINDRKNIGYPPYKTFIKITYLGDKEETIKAKQIIEDIFKEFNPIIFCGFIAKLKGKYRTNVLIKVERNMWSLDELSNNSNIDENLYNKLNSLPREFSIDINPEDLL
jgi:primosomal protein N' (replication factor Y)